MIGTSDTIRRVTLQPIFDYLVPEMVARLPGFHAIKGCDITGHINGVGKKERQAAAEEVVELIWCNCPQKYVYIHCLH